MHKLLLALAVTLVPSALVFASAGGPNDDPRGFVFHGVALPKLRAGLAPVRQGTVELLPVAEGTEVAAGTLLVGLEADVQRAAVALAEVAAGRVGELERMRGQVQLTEARLARLQASRRSEPRSVTDAELHEAAGELRAARAMLATVEEDLAAARASLALERARLEESLLRAPFAGLVTRIRTRVGESVAPGTPTVELVDLSTLVAEVHLPAELFGRLETGRTVALEASLPVSRLIDAKLVWCDPVMDGATRSYRCVFEIDNADRALPAGFTVEPVL